MKSRAHDQGAKRRSFADIFHNEVTAWIVLAVSLAVTALAWFISQTYVDKRATERFSFEVSEARDRIVERMTDYEQVLRGGVALFDTIGDTVSRIDWQRYVSSLHIQTYFPGIQGVGYAPMVHAGQVTRHVEEVHRDGFFDYQIKPPGTRLAHAPVMYLEPFDWRNQRAFGYDMYSNAMRRAAMDHARDTGRTGISGRVTLVQETDEDVQAGFLVYLPVYADGILLQTAADRRASLRGFVYSPFRINDLMRGILGSGNSEVGFTLYDGNGHQNDDTLLYDNSSKSEASSAARRTTVEIPLSGRLWTGVFHSTPAFEAATVSHQPEMIAVGGLIVDILLFTIIWSLAGERRRVQAKADEMTAGITEINQRFELAQDVSEFGIWDFDLRDQTLVWDKHMHDIYGVDPAHFSGDVSAWTDRLHPEDLDTAERKLQTAIEAGHRFNAEFRIIKADGEVRVIEANADIEFDASGTPRRLVGINRDVTERRRSEEKLQLAASVFEQAHEGIVVTDAERRIIDINPAFTTVTGYSREEAIGRSTRILSSGRHGAAFYAELWRQVQLKGFWRGRIWNRRKSGEMFTQMETISAVTDADGEVKRYISVFSDITKLVEQQEKLEHLAHYDSLTGLPNRVLFADRMGLAMAAARRSGQMVAVCYMDLDGFKPVNDRFGHAAGDELLIQVADRLKRFVRGGDSMARLGGDEFALLICEIDDMLTCEHALDRLINVLSGLYVVADGKTVRISASIGVTLFPKDDSDADTLLRHADHAMYLAKQEGRGRYKTFDAEQNLEIEAHRQIVTRAAAALRDHEFALYFQPKVNMRTGEVIGAEALIRWNHPQRGLLSPFEFLPAVEGDVLAIDVGAWVIEEALRQQSEWLREGLEICVSINVSGRHLQHPGFADHLREQLEAHPDVPPALIELEVLETTALDDIAVVSEIIDQCRALGVTVSLDDFGTGYSSLTYLKRLPADTLKIDQTFVGDMLSDPEDLAIVEGIVGLGKAFRRDVIAEGVETEDHGKLLLRLGCDFGQGYGIAKPMPADELPAWVRNYHQPAAWGHKPGVRWLRDDLPLYAAEFHHCRWVDRLLTCVRAGTCDERLRETCIEACQFAEWYDNDGRARYGHLQTFSAVALVHQQVHETAGELVAFLDKGEQRAAERAAVRLNDLRPELLKKLNELEDSMDDLAQDAASTVTLVSAGS